MYPLFALASGLTLCLTLVLLAVPLVPTRSREAERMLALVRSSRQDRRRLSLFEQVSRLVVVQAGSVGRYLGIAKNTKLKNRLQQAGLRSASAADVYVSCQLIGLVAGGALGSFITVNTLFWVFAFATLGFMAPDFWLSRQVDQRRGRMRRSVPDAIDLLVICVNAGLGLDQALLRLGNEFGLSHRDLNDEFTRLKLERQAGKPRTDAWRELAERTRLQELNTLAVILAETDRFGTPISIALAAFAEEVRTKRRQHAEEAAAKTKIKIIFPLVLCIFPCILLVLLGPAMLSILHTLGSMQR